MQIAIVRVLTPQELCQLMSAGVIIPMEDEDNIPGKGNRREPENQLEMVVENNGEML